MESLWFLLPILLLLLLSAFFSGAETALTAASQPHMVELERQGDPRARIVNQLRANKEGMIGAILLGNNLVNILASALLTSIFISLVGEAGVIYATLVATALILVFAEVLPKTYSFYRPNDTALVVAPAIRAIIWVLAPITAGVRAVVGVLLQGLGVRADLDREPRTSEVELRGVISLHQGLDAEVDAERRMLSSILDLGDVAVGEVMTHRSATAMIDAAKSPPVILRQVMASPYSRLPVYRGNSDNIVGVLHAKDLLRAMSRGKGGAAQLDIGKLASPAWYIPESTSLLDQLREFRKRREHFALVVDEYGTFQGVVTLEDILEEIVGKMGDVPEQAQSGIRATGDGAYIVGGDVTVRDVNRELGWDLPDDRAATVAGLVMHEARRIPDVRQHFAFHGFRFEILRKKNNRITALKVKPMNGASRKPEAPPPAPESAGTRDDKAA